MTMTPELGIAIAWLIFIFIAVFNKRVNNHLCDFFSRVVNEVVDTIKTRRTSEVKEAKNRPERLDAFDRQVKTLLDKDYPEAAGMKKDQFLEYMNPLRDKFEIGDLIVITARFVSIPKQMSMVELNGKFGWTHLKLGRLTQADGVETPNTPYLIRDVENGEVMRNISPGSCVKQFKEQGRFGLVTEEGIAIVTHKPETLNDHCIDLPGSRCGLGLPRLCLIGNDQPSLNGNGLAGLAFWDCGSASCGSRIRA